MNSKSPISTIFYWVILINREKSDFLCAKAIFKFSSFDAWGHRRNPNNWSQWENGTSYITDRGFTGHQHMDLFGLINMNGRIYDPDLGRFISPDPYVQMPGNTQNFNRYSYALNNPLVYTDPSGEFLDLALFLGGAAILRGWFESGGINFQDKKFWEGSLKGLLQTGGMILGAHTATGPLSAIANMTSAMHGNIGFGPFNYDMNKKDFSLGYGPFDYNISENEFDYIFEKGNSDLENIMYGARTISFLSSVKEQHGSLFVTDQDKTLGGKAWQLTSRFTWEYVQTRVGMELYNIYDNTGLVNEIENHRGTQLIEPDKNGLPLGSGVTFGNYSFMNEDYNFSFYRKHEFGHSIISRWFGPLYLVESTISSGGATIYNIWDRYFQFI
jgi:RHS repeat-associated protein